MSLQVFRLALCIIYFPSVLFILKLKCYILLCLLSLVPSVCLTALLSLSVIPPPSHATDPLIQSLTVRVAHYQLCFNSSPTVSLTLTDNIGLRMCVRVYVCVRARFYFNAASTPPPTFARRLNGIAHGYILHHDNAVITALLKMSTYHTSSIGNKAEQHQKHRGGVHFPAFCVLFFLIFPKIVCLYNGSDGVALVFVCSAI